MIGICRGAQMMMIAESDKDFMKATDSLNLSIPLHFTKEAKVCMFFSLDVFTHRKQKYM